MTAGTLHPSLAAFDRDTRATLANWESLCTGLSRDQFNWSPAPGRWSIAQCLAHLNVVNVQDLAPLTQVIASATRRDPGPYRYPWHWRWFIRSMEPPVKTKVKAPKKYVPPPTLDLNECLSEYRRITAELLALVPRANGLDLARVRTILPAVPILKMPIGARFELLAAHDRRHLSQAREVRNHPDFPPA